MRFKLNLLLFLLVTAVLVASSTYSYHSLHSELYERFEERKGVLAKKLQRNLANALWNYDEELAINVVDSELASPDVRGIQVFQATGESEVLWISRTRNADDSETTDLKDVVPGDDVVRLPLQARVLGGLANREMAQGDFLGTLRIVFTRQDVDRVLMEQVRNRLFEIVILNVTLGAMLFALMSRMVIAPLALLSRSFRSLADNPMVGEIDIKCDNEFAEVVNAFNQIERRLATDIECRMEAEKNLRQSNAELTEALDTLNRAKDSLVQAEKFASLGSLVAGIAHEINTPVGVAVTGASFILEETQNIEKAINAGVVKKSEILEFIKSVSEGAQLVLSNTERAAHLIRSFKQVAVDEASEERRCFNLASYLDEVLTSLRPKYKNTRIKVTYSCPESIEMDTYPGLLTQVLTNLIVNALSHGYDEGDEGCIEIRAEEVGPEIRIECVNDGKVIPAEFLGKIFDPFFTTRRSGGGTGLGLNIVFNIVSQRLGGTVTVQSSAADGTKFTVLVPKRLGEKGSGVIRK